MDTSTIPSTVATTPQIPIVPIIIIIASLLFSSYFSATETAFSCFNRIKMKNKAQKGNKRANLVLKMYEDYDTLLSGILIGNNIVNILSASLSTIVFVELIGEVYGPTISTIVLTIVVLLIGEITPKTLAKKYPEKFVLFSAPILNVILKILLPLNFLFGYWKKLLYRIVKSDVDDNITEEELITMVDEIAEEGTINDNEKELIQNAIEFNDLVVGDIYTPRMDMVSIPVDMSRKEIETIFRETSFSRLVVYEENLDNVIGVLTLKDFYNKPDSHILDILQHVEFVTKTNNIHMVLNLLQKEKIHMAIVLSEYAETIGIITMEDILEELVGEIWDESDEIVENIKPIENEENTYIVLGYTNVRQMFEKLNISIEVNSEIRTFNGWIMQQLERFPNNNETFTIENLEISILTMNGRRIETAKLKVLEKEQVNN